MSDWVAENAARIQREGEQITPERVAQVAEKFRTQIGGGCYDFLADVIEHEHLGRPWAE